MRYTLVMVVLLTAVMLSGCATAPSRKANELRIKELQGRVNQLESETGSKDEDLARLERKLVECEEKSMSASSQRSQVVYGTNEFSSKMTIQQIQSALKKAGFYNGPVDGKMGPKTKEAIREFQEEYGLTPDGVAGAKTKSKLMNLN